MEKVKTIFFGSGEFAVPILKSLLVFPYIEVTAVVTQPDKPAGRKKELSRVPVSDFCREIKTDLRLYQPHKYKDSEDDILGKEKPDLIIVADYGQLLPEKTINYPKFKCLNVHGSLLPDLRGAVPIPLAILYGYEKTGVSVAVMTKGLDNGPVVATQELKIFSNDNTKTLKGRLAKEGANLLIEILPMWYSGQVKAQEQDHSKATFADKTKIAKENAEFSKDDSVQKVDRMIRAFYPWPIAWTIVNVNGKDLRVKVLDAKPDNKDLKKGLFEKDGKKLFLGFGDGSLEIISIQVEGKPIGSGEDYLYLSGAKIIK